MKQDSEKKAGSAVGGGSSAAHSSTPLLVLFVLLSLGGYASTYYLERFGGGFNAQVSEPFPDVAFLKKYPPYGMPSGPIDLGKVVYEKNCAICHQGTGMGLPGQFPPLAGSEWVLAEKPDRIIRIVLNGLQGPIEVNGQQYNGAMFAFKDMPLTDEDIANALSYIRASWGNKAPIVKADEVKAIRAEVKGRPGPWSSAELLSIPID